MLIKASYYHCYVHAIAWYWYKVTTGKLVTQLEEKDFTVRLIRQTLPDELHERVVESVLNSMNKLSSQLFTSLTAPISKEKQWSIISLYLNNARDMFTFGDNFVRVNLSRFSKEKLITREEASSKMEQPFRSMKNANLSVLNLSKCIQTAQESTDCTTVQLFAKLATQLSV